VQNNPNRIRWDLFVTHNTKGALPSRPSIIKTRQKALPPVRSSILTQKSSQLSDRKTLAKPPALPPIDISKKYSQNLPIMFILSKFTCFEKQNNKEKSFSLRFIEFNKIMFAINGTLQRNNLFINRRYR
jgi:hypothetical protein